MVFGVRGKCNLSIITCLDFIILFIVPQLNPQEGSRRLAPLEQQVSNQQKTVKSLNIEYKRKVMADLSKEAKDLENNAAVAVDEMGKVRMK